MIYEDATIESGRIVNLLPQSIPIKSRGRASPSFSADPLASAKPIDASAIESWFRVFQETSNCSSISFMLGDIWLPREFRTA